jgi:hypothetical protein
MTHNPKAVYGRIAPAFDRFRHAAVDIQTDFVERIQVVAAVQGAKPVFMAVVEDEARRELFEAVAAALPPGAVHGFRLADIHHRYRPLRIRDPGLAAVFESRSDEELPIFWIGNGQAGRIFEDGNPAEFGDDLTLGYPRCCAEWHYDCYFARGPEAYADVAAIDNVDDAEQVIAEGWRPRPGFFLPSGPIGAAIFIGNARYPFVDHVACPACLADPESPTARLDRTYAALADAVDPDVADEVRRWCSSLGPLIEHEKSRFASERAALARERATTVRGRDAYERHSRYLLKALGL